MEEKIVYFEKPGEENTPQVLALVKEKAAARGISKVVLASTRGGTARVAADVLEGTGLHLVIVPWQYGFGKTQPFHQELVMELQKKGHWVHFGTMLFHTDELYGTSTPRSMANLLRVFGQGTKVCIEIIMMACNGGCIGLGEKVIAVAGTASGADTAMLATASSSTKLTDLRVHEILCKPL
ncbi:MAG: pyruvate kinase alpha/beta domain-containing protein [Thermodesulfobacteriota bacterium]|nr:pyruvate kinase alpha/beta domain-containing protein [Thermodesulfobacteriota bacterium]